MPHLSYDNKEIAFKIVYCGPGLSGKTSNLVNVHRSVANHLKGELVSLDTEDERTLFFDFFPLELGRIEGYKLRFNLYTVPGQIYYEASRRLILDGADGVVFVADSQPRRLEENVGSYRMMLDNLHSYDVDCERFPIVLQYNKRDCEGPLRLGTLESLLGLNGIVRTEAVAVHGVGVMETIRSISRLVIEHFQF